MSKNLSSETEVHKLEIGLKFTSKWFEGTTEILEINEDENTLNVEIHYAGGNKHSEEWNLQHTVWGFERGDYLPLVDKKK